jgi:hypothetical protein
MNTEILDESIEKRYKESVFQKLLFMCIWVILTGTFVLIPLENVACYIVITVSVIVIVALLRQPLTNTLKQAVYSWIRLLCIISLGISAGRFIQLVIAVCMIIGVSLTDVLSFTRYGKHTANAKVMAKKDTVYKLVVLGYSLKTHKPVPTKGFGDFFFYTVLFASVFFTYGYPIAFGILVLIFFGDIINSFVVGCIYKKPWYKGFPATFIPLGLSCIYLLFVYSFLL